MQAKVCPKCAAENDQASSSCWKCYAPLDGVSAPQSQKSAGPTPIRAPAAPPPAHQNQAPAGGALPTVSVPQPPPQPPAAPGQNQTVPYTPRPDQHYGAPLRRAHEPLKMDSGTWTMVIVLVVLVACGVGYALWLHSPARIPATPPDTVVLSFLEAKKTLDLEKVAPYLSKESIVMLRAAFSSRAAQSAGIERPEVENMFLFGVAPTKEILENSRIEAVRIEDKDAEENTAVVRAKLTTVIRNLPPIESEFEYVLVVEGHEWKVDLRRTARRVSSGAVKIPFPGGPLR